MLLKGNWVLRTILLLAVFSVPAFSYDAVWVCGGQEVYFSSDNGQNWDIQLQVSGQNSCGNLDIDYPGFGASVGIYNAHLVAPISAGPGTPWSYAWGGDIAWFSNPVLTGVDNRGTRKFPIVCGQQSTISTTYGTIGLRYMDELGNFQWLGNSWEDKRFHDIDMFDSDVTRGYTVGSNFPFTHGLIMSTTNGGKSWFVAHTESAKRIRGIQADCDGAGTSFAVGDDGLVLKIHSSSLFWVEVTSPCTSILNDVHFINQNVGWVVGGDGAVFKTTDGGTTWTDQSTSGTWNAVFFKDANTGWIAGSYGIVLMTTDSGANWTEIADMGYHTHLLDIEVVSYATVDELNSAEAVFGSSSSNSLIENQVAYNHEDGVLNMTVDTSGSYSVSIYDVSGRSVCEADLGNLDAGTHSISVPVNSNLTRGVYYFGVQSNGQMTATNSFLVL